MPLQEACEPVRGIPSENENISNWEYGEKQAGLSHEIEIPHLDMKMK